MDLSAGIFRITLLLVISGIGKSTDKLNEERVRSRKIFQMFGRVSGYSDSGKIGDKITWTIPEGIRCGAVTCWRQFNPLSKTLYES